jgi:hypothetical protein
MSLDVSASKALDFSNIPSGSSTIHLRFAALQMKMAGSNKQEAIKIMDSIQSEQDKTKKVSAMIQEAKTLLAKASSDGSSTLPREWIEFFGQNDIKFCLRYDDAHMKMALQDLSAGQIEGGKRPTGIEISADEWQINIDALNAYRTTLGVDTQQKMVYVNDYMGQYNAYLTGANSAIKMQSEILINMARNIV